MTDHKKPTNSGMTAEQIKNLDNKSFELENKIWSLIREEDTSALLSITNILGELLVLLCKDNKNLDPFNWLDMLKSNIRKKT